MNVESQVGTSKNYENVDMVIYLLDQKEEMQKEVHREHIAAISPRGSYSVTSRVKLEDLPETENEYFIRADLFDAQGSVLFTMKSVLFTVRQK